MPSEVAASVKQGPDEVRRILVREVLPGDERKFVARSNDSPSGGGARDLRLRPDSEFVAFIARMFPNTRKVARTVNGVSGSGIVHHGKLHWVAADGVKDAPIEIWQATNARPGEMRIAKVHNFDLSSELAALKLGRASLKQPDDVPPAQRVRLLLLFVELWSGRIFPAFAFSDSLNDPAWDPKVSAFLKRCLSFSSGRNAASGWIDLELGSYYP